MSGWVWRALAAGAAITVFLTAAGVWTLTRFWLWSTGDAFTGCLPMAIMAGAAVTLTTAYLLAPDRDEDDQ